MFDAVTGLIANGPDKPLITGDVSFATAKAKLENIPARTGEVYRIALNINNKEGWSRVIDLKLELEKDPKWRVVRNTITTYGVFFDVEIVQNPFPIALLIGAIAVIAGSLMVYMTVREVRKIYSPAPGESIVEEITEEFDPVTGHRVTVHTVKPSTEGQRGFTVLAGIVVVAALAGVVLLARG